MTRGALLDMLADRICRVAPAHPTRVAIDGVDAAGKTTLADALVDPRGRSGRFVIRASIDRFHHLSAVRYQKGRLSPDGYYEDSFNTAALVDVLLAPLGPGGHRRYRRAIFDLRADQPVEAPVESASPDAVLLFDGVFLLRPELQPYWDFSIFVRASFDVTLARAAVRDRERFGDVAAVRDRYERRYIPGQRLYLAGVHPERVASVVIDNDDEVHPRLVGAE
jgi:uridine kinase